MPNCPYCEEWHQTNKGLEIHITKKHTYNGIDGKRHFEPTNNSMRPRDIEKYIL